MSERQEPTISTLGSSDEDGLEPSARRARAADAKRKPPPVSSRPVIVKSTSGLTWFGFLLSLLALAGVGFVFYQMQQKTQMQEDALKKALARVIVLEDRLSLSDDESTQSMAVLQTKVKENSSEVRKLWGVAYDRNRKAIDEANKTLSQLKKAATSSDKKWRAADETLKNTLDGFKNEVNILNELMDTQQAVIQKLNDRANSDESLKAMDSKLNSLQTKIEKRLRSNEEAIEAIDAFRVQVNRDLLQLKGG